MGVIGLVSILGGSLLLVVIAISFLFRRVVATNEVHIVQCSKHTTSYGKDTGNGNSYYQWPSFIPVFGVTRIVLPTSVFDLDLKDYEAYDKGRLPFIVDVKAFFRVSDSNMAAQRVSDLKELEHQLEAVVQGAVRTILASSDIEEIMQGRSKFGEEFTKEVHDQLKSWGVATVKNIELMDIRDAKGSQVIHNIMEKKKSQIEMESRQEVAKNKKIAQVSEIEANREIELQTQEAAQAVGLRTVEAQREVKVAEQIATQALNEQSKITKQKEMEILSVEKVRAAEIEKDVKIVGAEQEKQAAILRAEGQLETVKREAEGVKAKGEANAEAERAMQLAPVNAQIELAHEIGDNEGYQHYLLTIEKIKAQQIVGLKQAEALSNAQIKVISSAGNPSEGLTKIMDLFSTAGGQAVAGMFEGLAQTENGQNLINRLTKKV